MLILVEITNDFDLMLPLLTAVATATVAAQLLSDPGGLGRIQLLAFAKGSALDVAGLGAPGHAAGRSP